jgi:hypothetical protein
MSAPKSRGATDGRTCLALCDQPPMTCALCGAGQEPATALAGVHEPGSEPRWLCPDCARRHVREIEAKLAPEWWVSDT